MKQILSLSIALFLIVSSSFANGPEVSKPVLYAFQQSFAAAREVSWTEGAAFYKATFLHQGKTVTAFYSLEGELMAVTRNLSTEELPAGLRLSLKSETGSGWISELFLVSKLGSATYYAVVENGTSKVVLQSRGAKKWSVYQTEEK
jgi:hypothetical protein